jgi:hypothetical protein
MPRIEPTVSLGNIISLLATLGALAGIYASIRSDISDARAKLAEQERRLIVQEIARERDDRDTGQLREQLAGRLVSLEVAVKTLTGTIERMQPPPHRGNL